MGHGNRQGTSLMPALGTQLMATLMLVVASVLVPSLASATALPATIEKSTTLTAAGNPYTNAGTVTIKSGVTVTAEPGAELKLGGLTVNGTLKTEGTTEKPVLFTSQTNTAAGQWQGIAFNSGSGGSVLDHAEVRYTGSASLTPAIAINGVSPTIKNSTIKKNTYWAIRVTGGGAPDIGNNAILDNGRSAINFEENSGKSGEVRVHDNLIDGSANYGIFVWTTGSSVTGATIGGNTIKNNPGGAIFYEGGDLPPDIDENTLSGTGNSNRVAVSGTVSQSVAWTDHGYPINVEENPITIAKGGSLTLGAGFALKFKSQELVVNGTLNTEGTAEKPALLTSLTNTKAGQWKGISVNSGSSGSMNYAEVRYTGSTSNTPAIAVKGGASPTIKNSTIRNNTYWAIRVTGGGAPDIGSNTITSNGKSAINFEEASGKSGEVKIHDNLIEGSENYGIYVWTSGSSATGATLGGNTIKGSGEGAIFFKGGDIPPDIDENTLSGNGGGNKVTVSGTISQSGTWTDHGYPIRVEEGPLTIESKGSLTLGAGFPLKFKSQELVVNGTLNAEGTAEKPALLTSVTDTSAGQWKGISFNSGSGGSVLDHAEVRYTGSASNTPAIAVNGVSPTIKNSTLRNNSYWAVRVTGGGAPNIGDNTILNNGRSGVNYEGASGKTGEVRIHDNLIEGSENYGVFVETSGSSVTGTTLGDNTIKGNAGGAVYFEGGDIPPDIDENTLSGNGGGNKITVSGTVNQSATWTDHGDPFRIEEGSLTVAGGATLTLGAGFTLKFDNQGISVSGTLDANGSDEAPVLFTSQTNTGAGQWQGISFNSGSSGSALDHAEVRYAGSVSSTPAIAINGVSPTIKDSIIRNNSYWGIRVLSGGSPSITHSHIRNNGTTGINVASGSPTIKWNRIHSNSSYSVFYEGSGTLDVGYNDWGCSSGPSPAGCGGAVNSKVKWQPAITLPSDKGQCNGTATSCGQGADPVSLVTGGLTYSHRDLLLTNKSAMPLEFVRAYNSGDPTDSGFGPGWSQTGLISASLQDSGDVMILREDGRQDIYTDTPEGFVAPSGVHDELVENPGGTFTLTALDRTVYDFDETGRITTLTDDHGLKTTYGYDENGRLATITDPSAQTLTFTYNESNHVTKVADSTGREVKYAYSGASDLKTATDALAGVTEYAYDGQHRLTSIKDPRGNVILKNTYDEDGRVIEQRDGLENLWKLAYSEAETVVTEPEGGKITYGFDGQDRVVSEKDQLGHKTTTSYDAAGNVDEVVQPGGAKWEFGHDAAGNLTSVLDPEGGERSYEYDAQNHLTEYMDAGGGAWSYEWSKAHDLTKIVDPEKGETTLTYNESGQPFSSTDPNKHKTEFTYDPRGNRLTSTDALSHKTSFEYNSRNYLISKTAPGLKAEGFERNALGDLLTRTTPEGNKTKYAYDANGMPTQITDPAENVWKTAYNAMERPTTYTDPLEQQAKVSYNGNLKPTKVVNRRGKEATYAYDLANQITEVHAPEGGDWTFGYDSRGNRASMVDPREGETTYEYDLLNRMTKASEPLEVTTEYDYDANGDLTSVKDPRGNTTEYVYDKLGRMVEVAQPLEKTTTYSYDAASNLLGKNTAAGTLEYEHDAANHLTAILAGETTLRSYGYDAADRRTSATDAEGHKIEIGYNEDGLPSSIKDGRGQSLSRIYSSRGLLTKQEDGRGTLKYEYDKLARLTSLIDPQGKALGFGYDPEGNVTELTRPNGVTTTNVYNEAGRLAETTSVETGEPPTTLESLKYGYNAAGDVTSKIDQRLEQETTYSYDPLNRVTEFNPVGEGATTYGYDKAGNRTEAGLTTYAFNALNQLTEASDGTTYGYDGAGRLTSVAKGEEETTYGWNLFDHLATVEGPGGTASYAYDALERLSERKGSGGTLVFHYGDLSDMPTYATNGEGETTTSYVQGAHGLIEQRSGETTSYPLRDAHGDVTAIANEVGEVTSRQSYDPWGAQLSGPSIEMGYLGAQQRRFDPTSGLIQMGARSYGSTLGSFMSEDPVLGQIGLGATSNRYPYVWDNPLGLYDLDGRFPSPGDIAGAVGDAANDTWNVGKELVTHPGESATNAVEYWAGSDSPASYVFGPLSVLGDMAINPSRAAYYLEKANPAQMAATGIAAAGTVGIAGVTTIATASCFAVTPELEALHVCTGVATIGGGVATAGAYVTYEIARR